MRWERARLHLGIVIAILAFVWGATAVRYFFDTDLLFRSKWSVKEYVWVASFSSVAAIVWGWWKTRRDAFLAEYGLTPDDIQHWILHPGGAKVIGAYEAALGIDPERLLHSREVLRHYGNMSSATIFFVLDAFLRAGAPAAGEYGLLAVLGPGFSCDLALIRG